MSWTPPKKKSPEQIDTSKYLEDAMESLADVHGRSISDEWQKAAEYYCEMYINDTEGE